MDDKKLLLKTEYITKKFGVITALSETSVSIYEGDRLAVLGGENCGKTTLLRILSFNETPTTGMIYFEGKKIYDSVSPLIAMRLKAIEQDLGSGDQEQENLVRNEYNEVKMSLFNKEKEEKAMRKSYKKNLPVFRQKTAMVYSNYNLLQHKTVFQNMMEVVKTDIMTEEAAAGSANGLLARFDLQAKANVYPNFLTTAEIQRIAVLSALVRKPQILMLDVPFTEPDSGMADFLEEAGKLCGTIVFSGSRSMVNKFATKTFELQC